MKHIPFLLGLAVFFLGCNGGVGGGEAVTFSEDGYELQTVSGTLQKAVKRDGSGVIIEEGLLKDGLQTGAWTTYYPENNLPKTIINYANGMRNGLYLEMNDRGQIELRAGYMNNKLDGPWGVYKFGRPTKTAFYANGVLDGTYREYNMRDGSLLKEINYKNGEYDGPYKFFNDKGEVTLEYEYKNGEKVGGGILQEGGENAPR